LSGLDYLERDKAYSYLVGAEDATEGTVWCHTKKIKTHELAYDISGPIAAMKRTARKTNAAPLLIDLLRNKYPCPAGGKEGGRHMPSSIATTRDGRRIPEKNCMSGRAGST
jgi:Rap1a immunity proteins